MARLAGVDIPPQKRVVISLMYITGIGRTTAEKIAKAANINPETRTKDLSEEEGAGVRQISDRMSPSMRISFEVDMRSMVWRRRATSSSLRSLVLVSGLMLAAFARK